MKKAYRKKQDAVAFAAILSPENKVALERTLESMCGHSVFDVKQSIEAIEQIIGERATIFLQNLMGTSDIHEFLEDTDVPPEARKYVSFLFATYAPRLHSAITGQSDPGGFYALRLVSTRIDVDDREPFLKFEIVNDTNKSFTFEDTLDSIVILVDGMIENIVQASSQVLKLGGDLGVGSKRISKLKRNVEKLNEIVTSNRKKR